jgi:hypothetical protein
VLKICRDCGKPNPKAQCSDCRRGDQARHRQAYASPAYRSNRAQVLDASGHRCLVCGDRATTADHRVPVEQGGSSDLSNLVALCLACNGQRQDRSWNEWIVSRRASGQRVRPEALSQTHPVFCGRIAPLDTPPPFRAHRQFTDPGVA